MNLLSEKEFSVRACETDHLGLMRLSAIFQVLQETAEMNAKRLGFSYDYVTENQEIWVLSRMHAKFTKVPKWQDPLKINTWPVGQNRIFGIRDYTIKLDDNLIGTVTSSWVLIDLNKRRIKRMRNFPKSSINPVFDQIAQKVDLPNDLELISKRVAQKSELDINNHVNNAIYFNWITDTMSLDLYNKYYISEITVNYQNETRLGEKIAIYHNLNGSLLTIVIENETTGKTAFIAKVGLTPRD